jgi:poly-gamma-glutamate capsule biosynthesis protein CapA/YwtB (metallophosphatase superfamily)
MRTITLAAVGDFMVERRAEPGEIARVRSLLGAADLTIGNMDTVLSAAGTPTPKFVNLRGPRGFATDFRAMGFDAAVLANNHAMDFRAPGLLDMQAAFAEAGVASFGAGPDLAAATAPLVREIDGRRVALLGLSSTLPPESIAGPGTPGVAPLRVHQAYELDPSIVAEQPGSQPLVRTWADPDDLARALADVRAAKAVADIVVVAIHWGVPAPWRAPFYPTIADHQREVGRALIDAGADAIVGNHAHELLGVEFHRGKPIAYCLGNFWIHEIRTWDWLGRETIVLRLAFATDGAVAVEATPVLLDDEGIPDATDVERIAACLERQSAAFGTRVEIAGDVVRLTPTPAT